MSPTRRDVLKAGAGAAVVGAFAGCLDVVGLGDDEVTADGYAAFFTLHDWAEQVSGDAMSFEDPVGTGRMGHGWSPDADITPEVAATEMFIYLDTEEFSWAQDLARNLERDHGDVAIVDLLDGLEPYMIPFDYEGSDRMPDPERGLDVSPDDIADFDIWDLRSQSRLGYWHSVRNHWHGGLPDVVVGESVPIGIALEDTQGRIVPLGENEAYRVDARVAGGDAEAVEVGVDGSTVEFRGQEVGEVEVVFEIYRGDELVYDTAADRATVSVVEELDSDGQFYDPHTWVDPVIAREMVATIRDGLVALDPDNAGTYEDNAAAYQDRLDELDTQFEAIADDAELDVAVFAGHDSFQYLERRYGFELKTPTGVSPDAQASRDDIIGLIETIEENGIDTILYDPFEAPSPGDSYPQIVDSILDESTAEYAEPLTPASGTTEKWEENDWGYVEQMAKVNTASLELALNPGSQ